MNQRQNKVFNSNNKIITGLVTLGMILFMMSGCSNDSGDEASAGKNAAQVTEQTAPIGKVDVEGAAAAVEETAAAAVEETVTETAAAASTSSGKSGEDVYNSMCGACHNTPGIGAPIVGKADEWAPRIEKGKDTLYNNAINGFTGPKGTMMPPRGGGQFSDDEVKAAVDYMVSKSQ